MFIFFFFKQKTAYELRISDWSSDVCSSDLLIVLFDLRSDAIETACQPKRRDSRIGRPEAELQLIVILVATVDDADRRDQLSAPQRALKRVRHVVRPLPPSVEQIGRAHV